MVLVESSLTRSNPKFSYSRLLWSGKIRFVQGQGKVRELCIMSGNFFVPVCGNPELLFWSSLWFLVVMDDQMTENLPEFLLVNFKSVV